MSDANGLARPCCRLKKAKKENPGHTGVLGLAAYLIMGSSVSHSRVLFAMMALRVQTDRRLLEGGSTLGRPCMPRITGKDMPFACFAFRIHYARVTVQNPLH